MAEPCAPWSEDMKRKDRGAKPTQIYWGRSDTTMTYDLPKKCDRCGWDRDDGHNYIYIHGFNKAGEAALKETLCCDCSMAELLFEYRKTGRITSALSMEAILARSSTKDGYRLGQTISAVVKDWEEVQGLIYLFYMDVWRAGLREQYLNQPARGMKAVVGGTKVLLYVMAGRVSVQLEQEDGQFVHMLTTDEDKPLPLGQQGIGCTLTAARAMFAEATTGWRAGRLKPEQDDDVRIGL